MPLKKIAVLLFGLASSWAAAESSVLELFARGSISKNYFTATSYIVSVSGATGVAFTLIPRIRLEGRYTNSSSLQNQLTVSSGSISGTLNDIMTQTSIYSVGVDFDLLGQQSAFQPFIYLGAGYVVTERSYYFLDSGGTTSIFLKDPVQTGISANVGLGFRLRIANAIALEVEAFAYGVNVHLPRPLINVFGTAGIRIFI
jgi:hypothetical protein